MSEEQVQEVQETKVETEAVAETSTQDHTGEYIAESKKYRQRAQTAEAELKELKDNLRLQETKQLEAKEEYKELYENLKGKYELSEASNKAFLMRDKQKKEYLLSQLSDEDQEIYQDLPTMKLEKHIERLGKSKVQVSDAKEVTSSGKFATNTTFADMSDEDRQKARRNPKLWKQIVEGYTN